jgi:hypothetical protein
LYAIIKIHFYGLQIWDVFGVLYRRWQVNPDYKWTDGRGSDFVGGPFSNIPVLANGPDGQLHMFIVHNDNRQLYHASQKGPDTQTGESPYIFESLGEEWSVTPVVATNNDG